MRRTVNLLSGVDLSALPAGMHHDGSGLYLVVGDTGSRSWVYRYRFAGRSRDMGLGSLHDVVLSQARRLATKARSLKSDGIDPIAKKAADAALELASVKTFKIVAEEYLALHKPTWKNPKHKQQWENTLEAMAYPVLGAKAVAKISRGDVLQVLQARWLEVPETMSRLRGRIAAILDYSIAKGYRTEANVAEWKGSLKNALPNLSRIAKVQHHPAMPYSALPDFIPLLRSEIGVAARCLELTILCAVRTTEARCAEWKEFDLDAATWTIPAGRIKGNREHRVPLSPRAVAIVRGMVGLHKKYVFLGNKGKSLSDGAMLKLLERMKQDQYTVHGFRSTFRDWSGEQTNFPREICELALSHVNDDETEAAYLRTDFFDKRRKLMEAWAAFVAGETEPMRLVASAE